MKLALATCCCAALGLALAGCAADGRPCCMSEKMLAEMQAVECPLERAILETRQTPDPLIAAMVNSKPADCPLKDSCLAPARPDPLVEAILRSQPAKCPLEDKCFESHEDPLIKAMLDSKPADCPLPEELWKSRPPCPLLGE